MEQVRIQTLALVLAGAFVGLCMPNLVGFVRCAFSTMASEFSSGTFSMAFVAVPNAEVGKKIARGLVTDRLAACVNIIPSVTSFYEWEGKIEEDNELLLMIKTRTSRVEDVTDYVKNNHPYDVCEVITSKIDQGNAPYLKWIGDNVPDK